MADGTVYAGISPDTGREMYATPADAPLTYTFNEAAEHARKLNADKYLGHDDWRVPTRGELNVLFNSRTSIGGFTASMDRTDESRTVFYWSSPPVTSEGCWVQDFHDGEQLIYNDYPSDRASLRCVR